MVQNFWTKNQKVQNSKDESGLLRNIQGFIDFHGSVNRDYVSFVIK